MLALVEVARSISTVMAETSYNEVFARIYDRALDILPYDKMADFLGEVFNKKSIQPKSLLDLGCGTGSLAIIFAKAGYEVTGLDLSVDMLSMAQQKSYEEGLEIAFINQSMSELDLMGKYDVIYSFGDALNYLIDDEDLLSAFKGVNEYLSDDGYFIFDVNTIEKFRAYGDNTFTESEDDFFYIWENEFDEEEKLNYYYVEIFSKLADEDLYERSFETHTERGYEYEEIISLLKQAGFRDIETYTDLDFTEGTTSKDRLYFICTK